MRTSWHRVRRARRCGPSRPCWCAPAAPAAAPTSSTWPARSRCRSSGRRRPTGCLSPPRPARITSPWVLRTCRTAARSSSAARRFVIARTAMRCGKGCSTGRLTASSPTTHRQPSRRSGGISPRHGAASRRSSSACQRCGPRPRAAESALTGSSAGWPRPRPRLPVSLTVARSPRACAPTSAYSPLTAALSSTRRPCVTATRSVRITAGRCAVLSSKHGWLEYTSNRATEPAGSRCHWNRCHWNRRHWKTGSMTGSGMADQGAAEAAFRMLPDVASRVLGAAVLYANDEFYADAHNLIAPQPAAHDPAAFGVRGKLYDGWETRRRRDPGEDFVIVRLAAPAVVRAVNIDTAHFKGNYPPFGSVDGATLLGYPSLDEVIAAEWTPLVDKTDLEGDRANLVPVTVPDRLVTHVRLTIHPDGGVARFRVFGEVVPDPRRLGGRVDLAALRRGGLVESCSNMFFAAPANVLFPGRAQVMSDGWETARRRDDGNDWLVVRLATPGVLHHAVIDTTRFVGNAPGHARLSDAESGTELLPRTRLIPDTEHRFRVRPASQVRLVRLDIYPDGGISRLRLAGVVPPERREPIARRWLDLLPPSLAAAADQSEFFD